METFLIVLPGLVLSSISALPLGIGLLAARRHMKAGRRSAYLRNLWASIASGVVVLLLLWGSLFGSNLASSSTAALIFLFAPIYASVVHGIVWGICIAAMRKTVDPESLSIPSRLVILIPLFMFALLMTGLIKTSLEGSDLAVAQRASNTQILHRLFQESRNGKADSFGVPLFLAQNPNTPPEILMELAKHDHPAVRAQVARHPRTPDEVVADLFNDCTPFERKTSQERLDGKELKETGTRSDECKPKN